MAISRLKEAQRRDCALLLFRMTSRVLYSAQYHRQHCALLAFEQFGALYMHNHDDKYSSRPGFEPGTPRLQAPVDTNRAIGAGQSIYTLHLCSLLLFISLTRPRHTFYIHIKKKDEWK